MKRAAVALIALVLGALGLFLVHAARTSDPVFEEATVVLHYLAQQSQGGGFRFEAGTYEGGVAVLGAGNLAFWVKDGVGYAVSAEAREAAPDLAPAPDGIQLDAAFRAAALAGE